MTAPIVNRDSIHPNREQLARAIDSDRQAASGGFLMSLGCGGFFLTLLAGGQIALTPQGCVFAVLAAISVGAVGRSTIRQWERLALGGVAMPGWTKELAIAALAGLASAGLAGIVLAYAFGIR